MKSFFLFFVFFTTSVFSSENNSGFFLIGEALFWHAKAGGTEYVYDFVHEKMKGKGEEKRLEKFEGQWGARLGGGFNFPFINKKIYSQFTRYKTKDQISYDNLDVVLENTLPLSDLLTLYSLYGVKKTWIEKIDRFKEQKIVIKDDSHLSMIGPRLGLGVFAHLFLGLNLQADVSGSCLYGDFKVHTTEKMEGKTHSFFPNLNFFLGLNWEYLGKGVRFSVGAGYEAEYFWPKNKDLELKNLELSTIFDQLEKAKIGQYADNLLFYGGVLKARVEF